MENYMDVKELAEYLEKIALTGGAGDVYAQAAKMLRKQADDLEYMQDQFDRALEFLAKCNNWSKKSL
jgi:glycogen synthase